VQTQRLWQHSAERSASGKADENNRKKAGDLHVGEQERTSGRQKELAAEMLL